MNKRILITSTNGLHYEGMTSVIYNYSSNMNKEGMSLFFTSDEALPTALKNSFNEIGDVIVLPGRKKNFGLYLMKMFLLLKKEKYNIIHIHGNSGTMLIEVLLAKICGIKKIIIHSHSTKCTHVIINKIMKWPMNKLATYRLACSDASGQWLYGKHKYIILNNAVYLKRFEFNNEKRYTFRKKINLEKEFVVGHIGHFSESKNQMFAIEVFKEFHKQVPNSKLVLVGRGTLKGEIHEKIEQVNLGDSVIMLDPQSNVEDIYFAIDYFVFPSKWEGLGIVLLEAQASGLPCIASVNVPRKTNATNTVKYLPIDNCECWNREILSYYKNAWNNYDREKISRNNVKMLAEKGFDIQKECDMLRGIYMDNNKL